MKGGRQMAIDSISTNKIPKDMTVTANSPIDTETKNIMNQITSKQQNLNRLSSDSEMSVEEKAKERQEIQKQIAELNRKLRMLRMEKKEEAKELEKQEEKKLVLAEENKTDVSETEKKSSTEEAEQKQEKNSMSPQNIQKIMEVGMAVQKERILQNVKREEKAVQNILEAEIKTDELYGTDVSTKKEKLHSLIENGKNKIEIEEKTRKQSEKPQNNLVKVVFRDDEII